jgi:hypothetical protein
MSGDDRIERAREYLRGARQRDINYLPPSRMAAELAETRRQLGHVLAAATEHAAVLAEIVGVLGAFDWEFDDRQIALERIERIAAGGER